MVKDHSLRENPLFGTWMDGWMDGWVGGLTDWQTDRQTEGGEDKWTDG